MISTVLDKVFRPIARLAMAKGLRFSEASERLRRAFVDTAIEAAQGEITDSKLSVLTGLQRRDIARLRAQDRATNPKPDPLSRLVALWLAEFEGAPLDLRGSNVSFDAIARRIRKDIHPRTSLDALEAAGTVAVEGDRVVLLKHAHVPLAGSDAQIRYLGDNVGDHLDVAVGNVLGDAPAFELAVHYDGLDASAIAELEEMWRAQMRDVFEQINARALKLQDSASGDARFRAGGYFRKAG